MPRKNFDRELQRLQDQVLQLGDVVEKAIVESVDALAKRDHQTSSSLIARDRAINEKRFAIESAALTLIATQQPLAGDLRTIFAVVEIATELERIADYAKGIAKVNVMLGDEPLLQPAAQLPAMAAQVSSILDTALKAFVDGDADDSHAGDGQRYDDPAVSISEPRAVTMTPAGDILVTEHDAGFIRRIKRAQ